MGLLRPICTLSSELHLPWTQPLPLVLAQFGLLPHAPSFLSPFKLMYGRPFLLGNLPPVESAPLGDYLLSLPLLRHLLREHTDCVLPQPSTDPITQTTVPVDWVFLQISCPQAQNPRWTGLHLVILTTPRAAKFLGFKTWIHLSQLKQVLNPEQAPESSVKPLPEPLPGKYFCAPQGH